MDVELIQWPAERQRRERLSARQRPRLLLVATDAEPPRSTDIREDWVRLPTTDRDLRARVRDLHSRVAEHQQSVPTIDRNGILRFRDNSVSLSALNGRLAALLVASMDRVVSRSELTTAGWGAEVPERNTVDVHMARLRRRLADVGLTVRTIRNRGFILEAPEPDSQSSSPDVR